ncbi:MAG: molybdate ABC transporter permease [Phycisphaerae bacterium]|jgi:molybdate transport system permease protein|nr:MAG: molybdate ABC transporter permease [Phycisphaerae bacterium]
MDYQALWLTFRLAFCTTVILLLIGVPFAYWLATTRWWGRFLVEAVVALPILLPPTVIGFYVLWFTGPYSPVGRGYETLTGSSLPFSFAGILLGSVIFNFPFAVRPFVAAFESVDVRLVEASKNLGAGWFRTFCCVILPLASRGILAGMVLSFAHTIGEFGVVLMVGGSIPGVTRTISIVIYDDVQSLNYAAAHQTSFVLLGFSYLSLCVVYRLQRRPVTL